MKIDDFRGDYRWLSNFHPCKVFLNFPADDETEYHYEPGCSVPQVVQAAKPYPSTEHAYQAAKSLDARVREQIRTASEPKFAKRLGGPKTRGGIVDVRPEWETLVVSSRRMLAGFNTEQIERLPFKVVIMSELLAQKFPFQVDKGTSELTDKLLATYPHDLIEGNYWHDTFWGVCQGKCKQGPHPPFGNNWLGNLLMERREGLIKMLREHSFTGSFYESHVQCDCFGCRCRRRYNEVVAQAAVADEQNNQEGWES